MQKNQISLAKTILYVMDRHKLLLSDQHILLHFKCSRFIYTTNSLARLIDRYGHLKPTTEVTHIY